MASLVLSSKPKQLTVNAAMLDIGGRAPPSPIEPSSKTLSQRQIKSLTEAWTEAQRRFAEVTKQRLDEKPTDMEKFTELWAARCDKEITDKAHQKKYKLLNTFNNIADGLVVLGDIVSSSAQVAVGFAGPCINALTFILQIPQRISDVYDTILDLYEEVENFLVRFKILNRIDRGKGLAIELIQSAADMLISFVDVTCLVHKVLRQTARTMLAAAFLRNDRGVGDALTAFRSMAQKLDRVTQAVSLEGIYDVRELSKEANLGIKNVMKSMEQTTKRQRTEAINKDRVDAIRSKIYAEGERAIAEKLVEDSDILPQTLDCLESDEQFRRWRDGPTESNRAQLILEGPNRSGKSYLMKALKKHLDEAKEKSDEAGTSIYVAYHDFTSGSSKNTSSRIPFALRNMAMQVAVSSTSYATVLKSQLSAPNGISQDFDIPKLWKSLKLSTFEQKGQQAKMYLLFDGIEMESQSNIETLMRLLGRGKSGLGGANDNLSIHTIFTIDPERQQFSFPVSTINTLAVTVQLVRAYTERELKRRNLFQSLDWKSSRNREKIMQAVSEVNFRQIERKLEIIGHGYHNNLTSKQFEDILRDDNSELPGQQLKVPTLDLTRQLDPHEVAEMNYMLPWLLYSEYAHCLELEELEAVLYLAYGSDKVQSLSTKVNGPYRELLYISKSDGYVHLKPEKETVLLAAAQQAIAKSSGVKSSISLDISIHEADKAVVQQFLWQLQDRVRKDSFDFDSHSTKAQEISAVETQSHVDITKMCLRLLNDGWEDESVALVRYARHFLPRHFIYLIDNIEDISEIDQAIISSHMVQLLSGPHQLFRDNDRHFGTGEEWLGNSEATRSVQEWLKSTEHLLRSRDRRWVEEALSPGRGEIGHMYQFARAVGKKWLRHYKENAFERYYAEGVRTSNALENQLFLWLDLYIDVSTFVPVLSLVNNNATDQAEEPNGDSNPPPETDQGDAKKEIDEIAENPEVESEKDETNLTRVETIRELTTADRIERAIAWVEDEEVAYVGRATANINIGYTYMSFGMFAEAEKYFDLAKQKPAFERQSLIALGRMHYALGHKEVAADTFREALKIFEAQEASKNITLDELMILPELCCELAVVCEDLPKPDIQEIVSLYKKSLQYKKDSDYRWKVLRLLCQDDAATSSTRAVECLKEWSEDSDKDGRKIMVKLLKQTVLEHADCTELENYINAIRDDRLRSDIISALTEIISAEDAHEDPRTKVKFLYLQGLAIVKGSDADRWPTAVKLWEEGLGLSDIEADAYWTYQKFPWKMSLVVAQHYFDKTIASIQDTAGEPLSDTTKSEIFEDFGTHLNDQIVDGSAILPSLTKDIVKRCLISMNVALGREDEARKLSADDVSTVIDILSDDDSDNDYQGVSRLMSTLCAMGDKVGTLTAFSLFDRKARSRPASPNTITSPGSTNSNNHPDTADAQSPQSPQPPDIDVSCSRLCDACAKTMTSSDPGGFWVCEHCFDYDLCTACHDEMVETNMSLPRCGAHHKQLRVYHTEYDEQEKSGNMVRIDWEWEDLGDGKFNRKGGRLVPLSEWLDILGEKWNVTKDIPENTEPQE